MKLSNEQLAEGFKEEFNKVADSDMNVEIINGDAFGFGSELDCFRVLKKYNYNGSVDFSENLNTYYVHIN